MHKERQTSRPSSRTTGQTHLKSGLKALNRGGDGSSPHLAERRETTRGRAVPAPNWPISDHFDASALSRTTVLRGRIAIQLCLAACALAVLPGAQAGGFLDDLAKPHEGRSMRATSTM